MLEPIGLRKGQVNVATVSDPCAALEKYLATAADDKPGVLSELLADLRALLAQGRWSEAAAIVQRAVVPGSDFTTLQSLYRIYDKLKPHVEQRQKTKLAILGSFTTTQLAQAVELALFSMDGGVEILEADYGVYRQEILDPSSELYRFQPNIVFLATSWRDLIHRPAIDLGRAEVAALVDAELADWSTLWRTAHDRLGCLVVQNSFDRPAWRQLDNHEMRHPAGLWRFVARVNDALADAAPPYVVLHDVDSLATLAGRRTWGDDRFFFHAKMPCAPEFIVDYGFSVASLLAAQLGLSKKCLVLDLDNTCWGGVIGDDGLGGIRLGQGEAEGEAFVAFQQYAKALKQRGILLAVCSKNEEHIAKEVFEKHTEMVLHLDDISCFMANWTDKAANLREIARRLNIGLNSLVLVDDNPAERALVRQLAPEVAVPELPDDPAAFIQAIEPYHYFQTLSIAREDLQRAEYYRANAAARGGIERIGQRGGISSLAGDDGPHRPGHGHVAGADRPVDQQIEPVQSHDAAAVGGRGFGHRCRSAVGHPHRLADRPFWRQRPDQRPPGQGRGRRPADRYLADELPGAETRRGDPPEQQSLSLGHRPRAAKDMRRLHSHAEKRPGPRTLRRTGICQGF